MTRDGGPAFPYYKSWENERKGYTEYEWHDGMTLRDYFAAKALNDMVASAPTIIDRTTVDKAAWATAAYGFADAMLEARDK